MKLRCLGMLLSMHRYGIMRLPVLSSLTAILPRSPLFLSQKTGRQSRRTSFIPIKTTETGVSIIIHYPALHVSDSDLAKKLNAKIRDAFFYGYNWNEEPNLLTPEREILTSIERDYLITKEDEQYFSVRISEYNEVRRSADPNEWETGLTLSLETGEALTLRDIVGEKYTTEQLLNSGAFHCM